MNSCNIKDIKSSISMNLDNLTPAQRAILNAIIIGLISFFSSIATSDGVVSTENLWAGFIAGTTACLIRINDFLTSDSDTKDTNTQDADNTNTQNADKTTGNQTNEKEGTYEMIDKTMDDETQLLSLGNLDEKEEKELQELIGNDCNNTYKDTTKTKMKRKLKFGMVI